MSRYSDAVKANIRKRGNVEPTIFQPAVRAQAPGWRGAEDAPVPLVHFDAIKSNCRIAGTALPRYAIWLLSSPPSTLAGHTR